MTIGGVVLSMACSDVPPPTCEDTDNAACFRGVYRSLTGSRVEEIETCAPEVDGIECVTSDSDGTWKIPGLPTDTDVFLTSTHEDYVPALFPQHTSMDWYDWYKTPIPNWIMDNHATRLGVGVDPMRGHLLFIAWEGLNIDGVDTDPVEGVQAELCTGVRPVVLRQLGGFGIRRRHRHEWAGARRRSQSGTRHASHPTIQHGRSMYRSHVSLADG